MCVIVILSYNLICNIDVFMCNMTLCTMCLKMMFAQNLFKGEQNPSKDRNKKIVDIV